MDLQDKVNALKDRLPTFSESLRTAFRPQYILPPKREAGSGVPDLSEVFESVYLLIRNIFDQEAEKLGLNEKPTDTQSE